MGVIESETADKRKEQIIRCIKLGMDLRTSMYTVACTDAEMEALEQDERFMRRVQTTKAILEMNLLDSHDSAMDIQLEQGKTSAVEWKLARINPSRWGSVKDDKSDDAPAVVIVEIPGLEKYINREDRIGESLEDDEDEEEDADSED